MKMKLIWKGSELSATHPSHGEIWANLALFVLQLPILPNFSIKFAPNALAHINNYDFQMTPEMMQMKQGNENVKKGIEKYRHQKNRFGPKTKELLKK